MICKNCEVEFNPKDYRQKFCSSSCSAKYNNSKRVKKMNDFDGRVCKVCQLPLKNFQGKYCSSACDGKNKKNETELKILNNDGVHTNTLRSYLFLIRKNECEICKGVEWFGKPMPLVMDHIDGNASHNSLDNLRLICPNCDRFTSTFGARNRGKGRQSLGIKRFDKYDK